MSKGKPKPHMTPTRLNWLRHLERFGPTQRVGWGKAPCHCMRLGWTDWLDVNSVEALEQLTDQGRAWLTLHDAAHAREQP